MVGYPMKEFLGMTDHSQHRKTSFDNHPLIPRAFGAQFEGRWDAVGISEAHVGQHNTVLNIMLDHKVEIFVWPVQRQPIPLDHLPGIVQQPPQPDANRPAAFVLTLFANLTFAATFSDGKQQFDRIAVAYRDEG